MFNPESFKRENLAEFISNPRTIRAFENLSETVNTSIPSDISDALVEAIVATANARAAIAILEGIIIGYTGGITASPPDYIPPNVNLSVDVRNENGSMASQSNRKVKITGGEVTAKLKNSIATVMLENVVALDNGAASNTATMTNAPTTGDPTKWIPIIDGGVTRYIPAW